MPLRIRVRELLCLRNAAVGAVLICCSTGILRAQCPNSPTHDFFSVGVAEGKPFVAERVEVQVHGSNGRDRVDLYKSSLARDSAGRIRIENWLKERTDSGDTREKLEQGDLEAAQEAPANGPEAWREISHYVVQFDCNENRQWLVDIGRRKIHATDLPKPGPNQPAVPPYDIALFQQVKLHPDWDLGYDVIAGIRSHGVKMVVNTSGSYPDKPKLAYETEAWISLEWALRLKEYLRNPDRDLLSLMKVVSFRSQEPDPELFQLPTGYASY